jgi:Phage integrase, N-terminal SAM-like domain
MTAPRPRFPQPKQLDAGMLQAEISSFALRLAAEGKAAKTIRTYTEAVQWFAAARLPGRASWEHVDRQDIQPWMAWLLDRYSSAYASNQYRALQQFFKWLAAEDQLPDPMDGLQPPRVTDKLAPVFTSGQLSRLEQACAGRTFAQRRDAAIIAVFPGPPTSGWPSWPACGTTPVTRGAVTSTCGSGRSPSAARAARTGSSGSATRPSGAWTGTSAPGPGTGRPGGRSCGWESTTRSR